jgi:hypothetical protein
MLARPKGRKVKRSVLVKEIIAAFPGPERKTKRPRLDDRRAVAALIRARLSTCGER